MTKLSKEAILPLMAAMNGTDYDKELARVLEDLSMRYTEFHPVSYGPAVKSNKTLKARKKNKAAKQSRKKNRK
jgi:hypothetical protein